ncbi:MFS transporter [Lederbergia wuyishanensis]|uniref:Oligosaccharide:H+ symporter n=1 Tax=Lederbergia wuyishanensis TaxID=1347903 RepID=A0ABU0D8W1_9BACI|nr:MFS transporter [Lederbergia wuyishanensis]MCJ8007559.1 MFS transporter [Lederbergia wuyishanensis]MDQ0344858.1 oligosaccharide:H+ symporter [Lederbergia wuyishanensis]
MLRKNPLLSLKMFLFFGAAISSLVVSFLPLYFQNNGLTKSAIGMFFALGTLVGLIAQPVWGFMSDKYKTVKKIIVVVLIGILMGIFLIFQLSSLAMLYVAGALFFFFFTALNPLSDNLAKRIADEQKVTFGSIRSWSSFGFAIISLASGFYFNKMGVSSLSIPMMIVAGMTLILSFTLKDANSGTKKVNLKEVGSFFKDKTLLTFFLLSFFIFLTHRINDSFISLYLFEIGGNEMLVGWLWFIGVLSEAILFITSFIWFRSKNPIIYIIIAGFLFTIRWTMVGFIKDPSILLSIQVMHGLCFAILYMGAIEYLYKALPVEMQATGHMVYMGIVFSITNIIGSSVGGIIFDTFSGSTLYFTMAVCSFIGTVGFILFSMKEKPLRKIAAVEG